MSTKKLQKMIVMSATYQQSSIETAEAKVADPANRFYSHFPLQRLDAEQIRDSVLYTAGDMGAKPPTGAPKELTATNTDRTVYGKVSRLPHRPVPAGIRLPESDVYRGAALLDERSGTAPLLHEQRLHLYTVGQAG